MCDTYLGATLPLHEGITMRAVLQHLLRHLGHVYHHRLRITEPKTV